LADENISSSIISNLRDAGFKVLSIKDDYRGLSDFEIIKLAVKFNSLILTEDSDFGEWIFSHKERSTGILYLRYEHEQKDLITRALITVLRNYSMFLYQKFTVITINKIRIRDI
jgi:predicted nuclease of predicted toxin-antitoxin system